VENNSIAEAGVTNSIEGSGGLEGKVRMTEDGLIDAQSNEETVYQIGTESSRTTGVVKNVDVKRGGYYCSDDSYGYVDLTNCTERGDSGGVAYLERIWPETGETFAAIANIHSYSWNSDHCGGIMADTISEYYPYTFS
jgi:hypothetical protein